MNASAELEGQGSGTGETGQDVGSPAKKMRTGSGFARGRDAGAGMSETLDVKPQQFCPGHRF